MHVTVDEQLLAFRGKCPVLSLQTGKVRCNILGALWQRNQLCLEFQAVSCKASCFYTETKPRPNVTCYNILTSFDLGRILLKKKTNEKDWNNQGKKSTILPQSPQRIHRYSHSFRIKCTKAGMDMLDKLASQYSCRRKLNILPIIVFSNILAISAYNAFVLFLKINPTWKMNSFHKTRIVLKKLAWIFFSPYWREKTSAKSKCFSRFGREYSERRTLSEPRSETYRNVATTGKKERSHLCPQTGNKSSLKCCKCAKFAFKCVMILHNWIFSINFCSIKQK